MKSFIALSLVAALGQTADAARIPSLDSRALVPPIIPAGTSFKGWTSLGCYQETAAISLLQTSQIQVLMTFDSCASFCTSRGAQYMALSNSNICKCDNVMNFNNGLNFLANDNLCGLACAGDWNFNCGSLLTSVVFQLTTRYQADQVASSSSKAAATSLAAYSSSVAAVGQASQYSASVAGYSASVAAAASLAGASKLVASIAGYSASVASAAAAASTAASLASYSASVQAAQAAASVAGYSASIASAAAAASNAASLAAYSASVANVAASASAAANVAASAAAYSVSAAAYSASASAAAAAASTVSVLPAGWVRSAVQCVAEGKTGRALTGASDAGPNMNYNTCLSFCNQKGFAIAGLEYGSECFCGNSLANGASLNGTSENCNMHCSGASSQVCGGPGALTLFVDPVKIVGLNADLTLKTVTAPLGLPTGWFTATTACIAEGANGRALTGASMAANDMVPSKCASFCAAKGFRFAGTEYGSECYCGNDFSNGAGLTKSSQNCNMPCSGSTGNICGGMSALSLYYNPTMLVTTEPLQFTGPVSGDLPADWAAASTICIEEVPGRALTGASKFGSTNTIASCASFCQSKGFKYAGLEYGDECFCGNTLDNGASLSKSSQHCTMPCAGDSKSTCGGPNAIQLYYNPTVAVVQPASNDPSSGNPSTVGSFTSKGCIQEVSGRALTGLRIDFDDMTLDKCVAACTKSGFRMAGIEYGVECFCGNSLSNGATTTATSGQCHMDCPGNKAQKCGGPNAIQLYTMGI